MAEASFSLPSSYSANTWRPKAVERDLSSFDDDDAFFSEPAAPDQLFDAYRTKPALAKYDQRTIVIKNLSERTTHTDIAAIVRGGLLLEIFLRIRDRMANVSFVEGSAAAKFLQHVKKHGVYLHGKWVSCIFQHPKLG